MASGRVYATSPDPVVLTPTEFNSLVMKGLRPIMRGTLGKKGGQVIFMNVLWNIDPSKAVSRESRCNISIRLDDPNIDQPATPRTADQAALLSQEIAQRAQENGGRSWRVKPRDKGDGQKPMPPQIAFKQYPFEVVFKNEADAAKFDVDARTGIFMEYPPVVFAKDYTDASGTTHSAGTDVPQHFENPLFRLGANIDYLFKAGMADLLEPADGQEPYLAKANTRGTPLTCLLSDKIVDVIGWTRKTDAGGEVRSPNPVYRIKIPVVNHTTGALGWKHMGVPQTIQILKMNVDPKTRATTHEVYLDDSGQPITDFNAHVAFERGAKIRGILNIFKVCLSNLGTSCISSLESKKIGITPRPPFTGGSMVSDDIFADMLGGPAPAPAAPVARTIEDDILDGGGFGGAGGLVPPAMPVVPAAAPTMPAVSAAMPAVPAAAPTMPAVPAAAPTMPATSAAMNTTMSAVPGLPASSQAGAVAAAIQSI
jgi:hypothetical protein